MRARFGWCSDGGMRLRHLLSAAVVLAVCLVLARLLLLEVHGRQGEQISQFELNVVRISRDCAGLLAISQDMLLHNSASAARRWQALHADLTRNLSAVDGPLSDLQEEVNNLSDVVQELPALFSAVEANLAEAETAKVTPRQALLADHLVSEIRLISDGAFDLVERIGDLRRAHDALQRRSTQGTMALLSVLMLAIGGLVWRRVLRPMAALESAAEAVRGGQLASRSNYRARDEFGSLSRAFDNMTQALQERNASLDSARRDLKNILDAIPSLIGYWDRAQRNCFANQAYSAWFGLDPGAMRGMHISQVMGDRYPRQLPLIEAVLRGQAQHFELAVPVQGGPGLRQAQVQFLPDLVDGQVLGFYAILHDITAAKLAEQKLQQANDRFNIAADSANLGVWEFDPVAKTLLCDERMHRLYGREGMGADAGAGEASAPWQASVHPDDMLATVAAMAAALRGERDFDPEFRILWPNGETRHLKASARVARDTSGAALRMTGVNIDITERKRAEIELRQTTALLQAVLDAASEVAIVAVTPSGVVTLFNRGAERMLGYRSDEVVGLAPALLAFHDRDELRARAAALSARLGERVPSGLVAIHPAMLGQAHEWNYRRKDGSRVPVSLVVTAMRGDNGAVSGYLGVAHDITRQREYEDSLRLAMHASQRANQAKSQFLANMSHEIRTPMNAVIGVSYLLGRTLLDEAQAALLDKLKASGELLLALLNDILDLSKIEAGELTLHSAAFNLRHLLSDVSAVAAAQAEAKGIEFKLDLPDKLSVALAGDALRLAQVLGNLLANAVKFTERGAVTLRVRELAESAGQVRLHLTVQDSGIGIAPEVQARLFQPFVQADPSITRRFGGSGLGLSIVKRLVALMGGEISLRSTPGLGSEFGVVLGLARDSTPAPLRVAAAPPGQPGLPGVRVLVVDDSDINRFVAERILLLEGAQVGLCANGEEAIEWLQAAAHGIDVVLMDLQMPVLDGYQATQRLRSELGLVALPVIALTAGALSDERQRAAACGMVDFVSKPFDPRELVRCIQRHLQTKPGPRASLIAAASAGAAVPPPAAGLPGPAWPPVAGIDTGDAFDRLVGDWALFRSLLRRLMHEFADIGTANQGPDPASRDALAGRLHKLRGGAGMLGAKVIAQLAGDAEAACRAHQPERTARLLRSLGQQMQQLKCDAAPLLDTVAEAQSDGAAQPLDHAALVLLIELLRQHSLAALDQFSAASAPLRQLLDAPDFERLHEHIDNLEFGAAANLLARTQPGVADGPQPQAHRVASNIA